MNENCDYIRYRDAIIDAYLDDYKKADHISSIVTTDILLAEWDTEEDAILECVGFFACQAGFDMGYYINIALRNYTPAFDTDSDVQNFRCAVTVSVIEDILIDAIDQKVYDDAI